jgi:hypothetical protein
MNETVEAKLSKWLSQYSDRDVRALNIPFKAADKPNKPRTPKVKDTPTTSSSSTRSTNNWRYRTEGTTHLE